MKIITAIIRKSQLDSISKRLNKMQQLMITYSHQSVSFPIKDDNGFEKITIIAEEEDVSRIVEEIRRMVQRMPMCQYKSSNEDVREYICVQAVERLITLDSGQDSL